MKRRMAAAALAVGVGMAGAAGVAAPGAARASTTGGWNRVFQSRDSGGFRSIAAISKSDVWAAGYLTRSGKIVYKPYLRHFNGSAWQAVTIPGASMTSDTVRATSASNVWLTGMIWVGKKVEKAIAYRWNGSHWLAVSSPHPVVDYGPGVTALSPSDVWIGWESTIRTYAAHWDGLA
jgi:hypothetical protein